MFVVAFVFAFLGNIVTLAFISFVILTSFDFLNNWHNSNIYLSVMASQSVRSKAADSCLLNLDTIADT